MNFYFCEKCNKRITEAELEGGLASDKKAKGIFCRSCSVGVKTTEFAAITDEQIKHATKVSVADTRRPSAATIAATPRSPSSAERHSSIKVAPAAARGWTKAHDERSKTMPIVAVAGGIGVVTILILLMAGSSKTEHKSAAKQDESASYDKKAATAPTEIKNTENLPPHPKPDVTPIVQEKAELAAPVVSTSVPPSPQPPKNESTTAPQTEAAQPQPAASTAPDASKAAVPVPATPASPDKASLPVLVDMKDPRIVYAEFQDDLLSALRNGNAQLAGQRLEQAEQNAILKGMQKELQQDRSILKWNSDLDKALVRGIEKLREIDNFELRLQVGAPIQVGKRAAFQLNGLKDGNIDVGTQGVSMVISIDKLQPATRQKLEIMGLAEDGAGLVRRGFVQLLSAGADTANLAALPAAIEKMKKAGAAEDELTTFQRLLKSTETTPRDVAAGIAWDELNRLAKDTQFSRTMLLAEAESFRVNFADSHLFSKKQDEVKALVLEVNLVIHLKFDDPKALSANTIKNVNECKIGGAPTPAPGKISGAISLDGAHDYVVLPDDLFRSRATMTVSIWFNTKAAGGVILGYQSADVLPPTPAHYVPILYIGTDGLLRGEFWVSGTTPIVGKNPVNDGQWHHVALSAKETIQNLYLDGVSLGTFDHVIDHLDMSKNQLGTGYTNFWPAGDKEWFYFNGLLDEFRFYDRVLSEQEIQWLSGSQPKSP